MKKFSKKLCKVKKFILNKFRSRNLDKETFKEFLKDIYLDIFPECVAKGSRL